MLTVLLVLIYISFISLGLPDALLGSAWPVMNQSLGVPLSAAGILSMIVSAGTIVSSVMSHRMIRRWGTGSVTSVSVAMTALALLGFSVAPGFWVLCVLAVPLGLGAGAVDAALNNFVSLHYKARHMNWLHCFWGIGATMGPAIMALTLRQQEGWRMGYRTVGMIQVCLAAVLFLTLRLWKSAGEGGGGETDSKQSRILGIGEILRLPYAKETLLSFFLYCSVELTTGLWAATFLISSRGLDAQTAARWASLFYLGITGGRLLSGFVSLRVNNRNMVRMGLLLLGGGILLLFTDKIPLLVAGLVLVGLGCAPIYPCLLHETPARFGKQNAQAIMGIQMATAYIGSTLMPPVFGLLADGISPALLPLFLFLLFTVMALVNEVVNRRMAQAEAATMMEE